MTVADSAPETWSGASPAEIVSAAGADDLFVLRRVGGDRFAHLGGVGRGAGWAGIVQISEDELFGSTPPESGVVRHGTTSAAHIFGPYYARAAAVVRVSHDVVVVFGGAQVEGSDDELAELGRFVSEGLVEVAPAKRLADELEVLTALQGFLQTPPDSLADALGRLAEHATQALSCEIGVAYLPEHDLLSVTDLRGSNALDSGALLAAIEEIAARGEFPKCVQQTSVDDLPRPLSAADGVVAYYLLELKSPSRGLLLLLHTTAAAPRGFTLLCQSLGAQMVEAAEPLLGAAALRDRMQTELDRAQGEARRDQLTGLANRLGWDEAVSAHRDDDAPVSVVMIDGRGLKMINDSHGHSIGDELIRTIAAVLRSCARDGDTAARLGGDEFGLLLIGADAGQRDATVSRIEEGIAAARLSNGLDVRVAIGAGTDPAGDRATALQLADDALLQGKRAGRRTATPIAL
jgi:diguanylate cyclase (GGDEF)-like protein